MRISHQNKMYHLPIRAKLFNFQIWNCLQVWLIHFCNLASNPIYLVLRYKKRIVRMLSCVISQFSLIIEQFSAGRSYYYNRKKVRPGSIENDFVLFVLALKKKAAGP